MTVTIWQVLAVVLGSEALVKFIEWFFDRKDRIQEKKEENPILKELAEIRKDIRLLDKATCKNFLVRCLADFEKGNKMSDVEVERFWEQYHHYIDELKENTYIKEWTERLKKEGKI